MNKPKVSVIGVGRLGLSFALLLDSVGYDVAGCDVNEKYVEELQSRRFQSKEPLIGELLRKSSMPFSTNIEAAFNHADILYVFVATPSKEDGSYNHKYIEQVASKLEVHNIQNKTLVIGCTTMPFYCDGLQSRLAKLNIEVVYNPEFIAQGSIIDGLQRADIVLFGGYVCPSLEQIYKDIMVKEPVFKKLTLTGAEIAKISINTFLAMKIAYANMIGEIIINSYEEESIKEIMDAIGSDSRIGNKYLSFGFPPGGPCIPRDGKALNKHAYFRGVATKFTHAIDAENERHIEYLLRYYMEKNKKKENPFIFSYLSYKEGVDILTDSYQLRLAILFMREGYKVDVPVSVKSNMDVPEEFKDFAYNDRVTFGKNPENGYRIN